MDLNRSATLQQRFGMLFLISSMPLIISEHKNLMSKLDFSNFTF